MASKFVVILALVAVSSSNPILINGVLYRDGRAYSIGQAYNYNGGSSVASANANGENAQAYGSTSGNTLARDGYIYPEQVFAQAQTNPGFGSAKAVAQAQNGASYYRIPAPATVITYEQNFAAPPEIGYEFPGAVHAQSSAFRNGISESAITSATSNGAGIAESSANTGAGSNGVTSSNARTSGGQGHADSKANSEYNSASTSANSQGQGSATSTAYTNGAVGVVYPVIHASPVILPAPELPAIADVKTPIFHTAYVPIAPLETASANANVIGAGNAASSAKITQGKTYSWRFGTLYDAPAAGSAQAQAKTQGNGNANAQATSNGYGAANAGADVNSAGIGSAKSTANVNGFGSANSIADVNAPAYGLVKSQGGYYGGSRTSADAQSNGYGSASSSAKSTPVSTAYKVANSQANSSGSGFARANAQIA